METLTNIQPQTWLTFVPTIIFSALASWLSWMAYCLNRDKLRLELFEKRWEIYENIGRFLAPIYKYNTLEITDNTTDRITEIQNAINAAHESFRGLGYHKSKFLFGTDIHNELDKIDDMFALLVNYKYEDLCRDHKMMDEYHEKIKYAYELSNIMQEKFKPYLYFGDISINKQK